MKLKKTKLLFIVTLIVLIPLIAIETNSATYSVGILRTPEIVYEGEMVTLTVNVIDSQYGEEYTYASLSYLRNGAINNYNYPEQSIPAMMQTLTWIIGPFAEGDEIGYKIYLHFIYADDYGSEWFYFTVDGSRLSGLTTMQIVYICIASVVLLAVIAVVIIWKIRKR